MQKLQKYTDEAKGAAADIMEFIWTKVNERKKDLKFILNVDQTPIFLLIMEKNSQVWRCLL